MKKIGLVVIGHSEYDDNLYSVLGKYDDKLSEIYKPGSLHLGGMDYSGLFGLMVSSGAYITQADNSEIENPIVEIKVEADKYERFLKQFELSLAHYIDFMG